MSILVNKNTKVIVQGLTGRAGRFHAQQCVSYGTQIVGGVTPGKGDTSVDEIPVFDTVENAINCARSGVPGPVFVEVTIDLLYPIKQLL